MKLDYRIKILYRKNLKMSPGKIAAQAVHAAIGISASEPSISVIVLGVSDAKFNIEKAANRCYVVEDAGRTEVPPNTETCLAFYDRIIDGDYDAR